MPSVPAGGKARPCKGRRHSRCAQFRSATCAMVAAVASDDPQIEPKPQMRRTQPSRRRLAVPEKGRRRIEQGLAHAAARRKLAHQQEERNDRQRVCSHSCSRRAPSSAQKRASIGRAPDRCRQRRGEHAAPIGPRRKMSRMRTGRTRVRFQCCSSMGSHRSDNGLGRGACHGYLSNHEEGVSDDYIHNEKGKRDRKAPPHRHQEQRRGFTIADSCPSCRRHVAR